MRNRDTISAQSLEPNGSPAQGTPDATLVLAARRGDKRAFVEIVARHQSLVCGITFSILSDFASSEDAAQEAFLTAWRKLHELREPERLRGWLGQIARNAALGYLRRERRERPLEEAPDLPDTAPAPDEMAASAEEALVVREALAKLPETYRLPLVLFYREGKSVRAVAEVLGLSDDAVKQRLARGRDLLRDQVSSLVESVLARTKPTAVFTMAIAVAIGALATPAAIASGVFAASSGTLTGSASVGKVSTSVFAAMSTSKALLFTAALVAAASVPLGYHWRANREHSAPPIAQETSRPIEAAGLGSAMTLTNSALYAEWKQLHDRYGTNSEAMPRLYQAISEIKDTFRRSAFRAALLSEWVQVNPAAGLKFLLGPGHGSEERNDFFKEWLEADPAAAVDSLLVAGKGWEKIAHDCLTEIARLTPGLLPDIAARLPATENFWDTKVREAFTVAATANLEQIRTAAELLTGPNREQALAGVSGAWAKTDPKAAIAWAQALPDGVDRAEVIRCALIGLATVNPTAALEQVNIVPPGGKQGFFASTTGARVLQEAVKTDFDGTVAWIANHPGQLTQEDLLGMAQPVTERMNADPAGFLSARLADGSLQGILPAVGSALLNGAMAQQSAVWDWLKTQPETDTTKSLKADVLNAVAWQNPNQALLMVADLPTNAQGDQQVQSLANSLLNGGSMLYRFDSLYAQAAPRLQIPLLETAFNFLRGDNLDNPQNWIAKVSLLPQANQSSAVQSVARAWAEHSPEDAITWVQSLPDDATRSGAAASIAGAWAATDPQDATQWVSAMAPGPERDQSTRALAFALSETQPRDAWNLAISINDPAQREQAASHVATMMALRDPASARQWITEGPFPPEQRAQLLARLMSSPPR